ncbi:MAG: Omp28-related outer membrane protein [Muribaculaceae bacterium]|nr:Omp28-related outer membrane protein [Muribaculaceae bacterium]
MFRQFILTSVVAAITMAAATNQSYAETPRMAIGYTGEELPTSSSLGIDAKGTIKAAIQVNPADLGNLDNVQIVGFNVGLASRINISSMTLWAAESLDSDPLAVIPIDGKPAKGWNEVSLSDYVDIPCAALYIGYTIETSGASYPVAAAGITTPDGLWLDNGNGWENLSDTADGMLAMSVMITADNLPLYNLTLVKADIPSVMHSSVPTEIPVEIRNSGAMTVTGFSITCDEGNGHTQTFDISAIIKPNERLKTVLEVLPLSDESETPFEFTVAITSINEGEDTNPADNAISAMTRVSRFTFTKRLLVEEFTTMACVNCPRAAKLLHQALEKDEYRDRVFGVCHHSGFYTDFLTQPCDEEMLVLYGDPNSTYAPAMCFDRLQLDEGSVAVNVPLVLEGLTDLFDFALNRPAEVDLNVSATWNNTSGCLDINVEGGCVNETPPTTANRITVYVLENDINTPMQSGGDADYMQQHVIRAYNATWGEDIDWQSNGHFTYSVSLPLPDNIVRENMEVVGVISYYTPTDALNCAVSNTSRAPYINWDGDSSISLLPTDAAATEVCYDLLGTPVSSDTKGIVIKVRTYPDGTQSVIKTLNR